MPESYRCECTNDTWEIFNGMIKCAECGKEYELDLREDGDYIIPPPKEFNIYVRRIK